MDRLNLGPADFDPLFCPETRYTAKARKAAAARIASGQRRLIDPTTSEREYTPKELELFEAIQEYQRASGRKFPTWSEVLEVLQGLGYDKAAG